MSFTIKELESLSGIKAHTIRIWEQRYNFLKPDRTQTNIRTYSNDELKVLLTVALLNKYGYKISRINDMPPEQRNSAVMELPKGDAYNEGLVNEMIGYMIDMDSHKFEELLNDHIRNNGIEKTIKEIVFYFLERVGILWQTNRITPVQEHIVSNIIRQKIISALEDLPFGNKDHPLFLLFLPEDEHHELGLLFVYYLLRKKGIPVLYLGANVPLKDVHYLFRIKTPQYLYLHLTSFPRGNNFHKYLLLLSSEAESSRILISGSVAQVYNQSPPKNITMLPTLSEVSRYISNLN